MRLEAMKFYRSFTAGQPIMYAGDQMTFVGSVVTGTATLERLMGDGRKQTMGLLLPSDYIGRPGRETALYDVTAVTDVTLCCFRRSAFEALVADTPHIAQRMLEMALDELDAARDWMLLLGRKTAREKIATFLVLVMARSQIGQKDPVVGDVSINLPLSREAMADYLGLTIETVSRQFSTLRKDGLIVLNGRRDVMIPDTAALKAATGHTA